MTSYTKRKVYIASLVLIYIPSVFSLTVTRSLCEGRCETSTPHLQTLKMVWHKMSKRIGKEDLSFEDFVQSLVAASERYRWLKPLRGDLLSMISKYQDCVKACEHQHSKRTSERTSDSYIRPAICLTKEICF